MLPKHVFMKIMKYAYIVLLVMVLAGMFYFGGRNQASELSYQNASSVKDLPSTYTKRDYCAPEIDTEVSGYKLELSAAQKRIAELEKQLEEAKLSDTPTPTPSVTETPTPTLTPTEAEEPETGVSPASSSANN
jgi:hypothetical protein